ncbi:hypothetical protein ACH5RR_024085 [Cinchona calisaya]|uniref:Mechanosensitive ion channel MscS domain-containing protein n=1 Tax=Cinchona calisaya TaxID=153742 RepID=A0ABD2ZCL1_9GENT
MTPDAQQLLHPLTRDVVIPLVGFLVAISLVVEVLPMLLRGYHARSEQQKYQAALTFMAASLLGWLLTTNKVFSLGQFFTGLVGISILSGIPAQSFVAMASMGGLVYIAQDILRNVLGGLSIQISKSFSVGDVIKVGSIKGEVLEMGVTTTLLLIAGNLRF